MDQWIKETNIFCMALMASKCEIMDLTIYSAPVMYSYFTHPAVDDLILRSPQLAWPANQCPLTQQSVHMSLDLLSINSASAQISASSTDRASKKQCMVCVCVYAPGGCYRQMLIMVTHWPPVTSQYTDNELDHVCCVVVTGNFFKPLFIQPRFTELTYFFSGKAKLHTHQVSQLHTWTLSIVTAGLHTKWLHWSKYGIFKDTAMAALQQREII